jgi:methionyl-tRNA formyltransferase
LKAAAEKARSPFSSERIGRSDLEVLVDAGCELIISAAYPYKIPVDPKLPLKGCNIHPTMLPEGRGPWPLPHLILNGLKDGGVTIHKLTGEMDAGDILIQEGFRIDQNENLETVSCKAQMLAPVLLGKLLRDFNVLWSRAIPQGQGTYWPTPTWAERTIDWHAGIESIDRIIRAFGKFDSCASFGGKDWVVRDATAWKEKHSIEPGTVAHTSSREVVVAASDGFVCIRFFEIDPDWKGLPSTD